MGRKLWISIGVCLLSLASPAEAESATGRKPNLIVILLDDLGYADLGCYGQKDILTPSIDRLAAEGIRFTQFYAGNPVCNPSRNALLTGQHTGHTTIRGNRRRNQPLSAYSLRAGDITVAEVLQQAGYATGAIGKWGLGYINTPGHPNQQGFDEWLGYLESGEAHNYYPEFLWKNEQKYPLQGNEVGQRNVSVKRARYSHDVFIDEALHFIEQHRDEPFFLYLAFTIPHPNNERWRAEGVGMEVPSFEPYTKQAWPEPQKGYAAMLTRLDADVGRLNERLKVLDLDEHTIVFLTADNGPQAAGGVDPAFFNSSGPLRGHKHQAYEGAIRVPMIVRWPGKIAAGGTSDQVWAMWDILPTLAELGGAPTPAGIDGISLVPTLLGQKEAGREQQQHEFLYWEFHGDPAFRQMVRWGKWKAIRLKPKGRIQLYDLEKDIGESENIAARHPDVVAEIEGYLATARTDSPEWPMKQRMRWRYRILLTLLGLTVPAALIILARRARNPVRG